VAGGADRTEVTIDATGVYWLEHIFSSGRSCVMHAPAGTASPRRLTPEDVDVGTLAWEYGGGSYLVTDGGVVVYSDRDDQRLYRLERGGSPTPLTPTTMVPLGERYADGCPTPDGRRAVYVRESHGTDGSVEHTLVVVGLQQLGPVRRLVGGDDFYSSPRISPDGRRLAWISWTKPRMPWDGSELWLADLDPSLGLSNAQRIAGGRCESVLQPDFSPGGDLHWVSDRSGWWNLYTLTGDDVRPLCPESAEFAGPSWQYGRRSYGFLADGTPVAVRIRDAIHEIVRIDQGRDRAASINAGVTWVEGPRISCHGGTVAFIGATPTTGATPQTLEVAGGRVTTLVSETAQAIAASPSVGTPIRIGTLNGGAIPAFWYDAAPARRRPGRLPPLMLSLHGGPTDSARLAFDPEVQLWTSNGFALLDLNYTGSTGFGSEYRRALGGEWGRRDLDDCVTAVRHLVAGGHVDGERIYVRGASAGGFLTLRCLTSSDLFAGGMARCPIADLALWRAHAHDFESRYTDMLVGPPSDTDRYAERSPLCQVSERSAPVLLVHGLADKVVPPEHSTAMAEAYQRAGRPCRLELLAGEPHGPRLESSRLRWLRAEFEFFRALELSHT
jgi:dipeptidyl aminopeptidase/acylaminoacyl peptidase